MFTLIRKIIKNIKKMSETYKENRNTCEYFFLITLKI